MLEISRIFLLVCFLSTTAKSEMTSPQPAPEYQTHGSVYPRSIFWPAFVSFILPGFDQYWEGQYPYALAYSGSAYLGLRLALHHEEKTVEDGNKVTDEEKYGYGHLGDSLYQLAGSLSAYQSFKTAVRTRLEDFYFIEKEDSLLDVVSAPMDLSFLARPTTFIPLGALALYLGSKYKEISEYKKTHTHILPFHERAFSAFGISYAAGVGEEAVFRGWLLPAGHYAFGNPHISNLVQGSIFGILHKSEKNPYPIVQTLYGLYDGWVAQRNGYSIREGIFGHFWWDFMIFGTVLMLNTQHDTKIPVYSPTIIIPF